MTEKQYRLNKWGTRLLKNDRPLFDWTNEADEIVNLLNEQQETIQQKQDTINEMRDRGLNVLNFYEDKLKNAKHENFQEIRDELWIVKLLLYEMGVIDD